MANLEQLEKEMNKCLDDFTQEIDFNYETFDGSYCTKDDMKELAKQTFYTMHSLKDCIIKYLKCIEE